MNSYILKNRHINAIRIGVAERKWLIEEKGYTNVDIGEVFYQNQIGGHEGILTHDQFNRLFETTQPTNEIIEQIRQKLENFKIEIASDNSLKEINSLLDLL